MQNAWYIKPREDVLNELNVDVKNGLSDEEVRIRQEKYGLNKLKEQQKKSIMIQDILIHGDF